ncbi:MAG: hypothetical protein L0271_21670 [Gemmatimonadetes bacterium]|nr:hypothetical protein [Gemmatimonadota bacterium]
MADLSSDLERALRAFDCAEGAAGFAAALGFTAALRQVMPRAPGADGFAGVAAVWLVAERPGLRVLLLELEDQATPRIVATCARRIRTGDATVQHLFLFADRGYRRIGLTTFGLAGQLCDVVIDRVQPRATDIDALTELVARDGEGGIALAVRWARALDRARVGRRFFIDFRAQRARIAAAWTGIPVPLRAEREQLALLLLCRLMFLYFLQRQGHLAGDPVYLPRLLREWRRRPVPESTFHTAVIIPLFFGALNRRPERRDAAARALGALPYLNGGLFERTGLERRYDRLDLPDDVLAAVFDELLERFRFTVRDSADDTADGAFAAGIDPEMLGRVFEGMMAEDRRGDTGTFFTPPAIVDRLVTGTLALHLASITGSDARVVESMIRHRDRAGVTAAARLRLARAARELRVLDPACGSGAFLLGALSRIGGLRATLGGDDEERVRRDIVARGLHGVDVQGDAALLCALRLWLALTMPLAGRPVVPLPNLDRRIRQGDALLDPLDLAMPGSRARAPDRAAAVDARVRQAVRALGPASARYVAAEPEERAALQRELAEGETMLARAWVDAIERRLERERADCVARAGERDLWGEPTRSARAAADALRRLESRCREAARIRRALDDARALPFFSFGVHFADAALRGFDLVLSNPPWVRAHRWPAGFVAAIRSRYAVCREPGWRAGAALAGAPRAAAAQIDLSLLFLERSLALLGPRGTLGMLLPAKILRSLYGGSARRMLMRDMRIAVIEDHSLDQRSVFRVDAFTTAIIATRAGRADANCVSDGGPRVIMIRRGRNPRAFTLPQHELPLFPDDDESPWLLAPRRVRRALRTMQDAGGPLGLAHGLRVRRGVFTGANDVLILREVTPRLADAATIRADGWFAVSNVARAHTRARRTGTRDGRSSTRPQHEPPVTDRRRYEALVEGSAIRPLLRGRDIAPWTWQYQSWVVWVHDDTGAPCHPPTRMQAYLDRHATRLGRRSGVRGCDPPGALLRVTRDALGDKLVWHDLAESLHAVAVPASVRTPFGRRAIVPLNSVYFIPVPTRREALLLAAFFNSTPVRTFARTIAERAKDARFRFFAWTIGALPLPAGWRTLPVSDRLVALSESAHEAGAAEPDACAEIDALVASAYGLHRGADLALRAFARWLG